MTVAEILEQVKTLSPDEIDQLVAELQAIQVVQKSHPSTGAEIVAFLNALDEPIELVDSHIEDPVEWVKAQRRKREEQLKHLLDEES